MPLASLLWPRKTNAHQPNAYVTFQRNRGSLYVKAFQSMKRDNTEDVRRLVAGAIDGDLAAFERLVRRFQSMAWGYAFAHVGDVHLSEDVAQEAFVDAYRHLSDLRAPEAFSAWLRTIVFKHCDRLTRGRQVPVVPLDTVADLGSAGASPAQIAERRQVREKVRDAVQTLSEPQRVVTTLFYLQCYSQREIADFLGVPVSTVKKRLFDARQHLKERMIDMVNETLRDDLPDELFSQRVVEELLDRPRPLEIEGHPVRAIWERIRDALPEYDAISGDEIVDTKLYASVQNQMDVSDMAYHTDDCHILRTHMTHTTFQAIRGRMPPVRLLAAGRCFRPDREDETHARVFHQVEGVCVSDQADVETLKIACERVLAAVFSDVECRWRDHEFPFVDSSMEFDFRQDGRWVGAGGCGILKPAMLTEAGHDADEVSGFAFGIGLERLAMARHCIDDIRELWRPPHVPA